MLNSIIMFFAGFSIGIWLTCDITLVIESYPKRKRNNKKAVKA